MMKKLFGRRPPLAETSATDPMVGSSDADLRVELSGYCRTASAREKARLDEEIECWKADFRRRFGFTPDGGRGLIVGDLSDAGGGGDGGGGGD